MYQVYRFIDPDFATATVPAIDITAPSYSAARRIAARQGVRSVRIPARVTPAVRMVSVDTLAYQACCFRAYGCEYATEYRTQFCNAAWQ